MYLLRQRKQNDSLSRLKSVQNGSLMFPKFSVNPKQHCALWGNEPTSDAIDGVQIRLVRSVQKKTQRRNSRTWKKHILVVLLVQSQSCEINRTVVLAGVKQ